MTKDDLQRYVFDGENRQTKIRNLADTADVATYSYDGNGLRVQKQVVSGTTTVYIFSGSKVIAEYDNGAAVTAPTREYIYSGSQLLAKIEGGATKYYHPDQLSNRVVTDSSGAVVGQSGHKPFGDNWYETGGTNKLKFTTYERDAEGSAANDYAMARYDMNRLGRFSSPDPLSGSIADPQSLNRYAYTRNDPVNLADPYGLTFFCVTAGGSTWCEWEPDIELDLTRLGSHGTGVPVGLETSTPDEMADVGGSGRDDDISSGVLRDLQTLAQARTAAYLALLKDPKCLAFLGGGALAFLTGGKFDLTGESGAGAIAQTVTVRSPFPGPNSYQININESGPFFSSGSSYRIGGLRMAGASPRFQAFVLFHELGHVTGAMIPDPRGNQAAQAANNAAIASNCNNALSSLSNTAPH